MEPFKPRTFKFKAWNKEARLLMKVSSIECQRGELMKKDHILLQFTGLYDKHEEEIYEMDILLISDARFVVRWHEQHNGWFILPYPDQKSSKPLLKEAAATMKRLCNYFESEERK